MLRDSEQFYLPNLHTFQNENVFYGSFRGLRFRVQSVKGRPAGAEEEAWGMAVLSWYGEYCLEESEIVAQDWFPMTEEGYQQVLDWLEGQYALMTQARQGHEPVQ